MNIRTYATLLLLAIALNLASTSSNADEIHNHGYIGTPQFNIQESRFSLFDANGTCKYRFNDIHFHPKNFIMKGDNLEKIYEDANNNCVDKILINSLPLISHWDGTSTQTRPTYYTHDKSKFYWNSVSDIPTFEDYKKLSKEKQSKFLFLINGFLHFDMGAIDAVKSTLAIYPELPIVGFGEIFGEHDILSDQMNPPSYIDSKSLEAVYELAGKKNMIVMIHNNLSNRSFKGPLKPIYQQSTEKLLQKHKKTTFILPHAGVMRNIVIDDLTGVLDGMLKRNNNLYIDLSFVVLENYIMPKGKIEPEWIALIEKHPNRFLIGSDYLGSYHDFYELKKFIPLLDSLSKETSEKISRGNFNRLTS